MPMGSLAALSLELIWTSSVVTGCAPSLSLLNNGQLPSKIVLDCLDHWMKIPSIGQSFWVALKTLASSDRHTEGTYMIIRLEAPAKFEFDWIGIRCPKPQLRGPPSSARHPAV
jgi:hypothetical protein